MSKKQNKYRKPFKVGQLTTYKSVPHAAHLSGFWLVLDLEWDEPGQCWLVRYHHSPSQGIFLVYDLEWRMPSQMWEVWYIAQRTGKKNWNWSQNLRPIEERDD